MNENEADMWHREYHGREADYWAQREGSTITVEDYAGEWTFVASVTATIEEVWAEIEKALQNHDATVKI
jgi:hypothetical protein